MIGALVPGNYGLAGEGGEVGAIRPIVSNFFCRPGEPKWHWLLQRPNREAWRSARALSGSDVCKQVFYLRRELRKHIRLGNEAPQLIIAAESKNRHRQAGCKEYG
jgi:hypothetical protein